VRVGIVDARSGNLTSLENTLLRAGLQTKRLIEPNFDEIKALVLPGQGRFGFVMKRLEETGFIPHIHNWIKSGKPLVGICVGMQVLFKASEEDPESEGAVFPEK